MKTIIIIIIIAILLNSLTLCLSDKAESLFSSFPHTVFSSEGRLHNVEKVARSVSDVDDRSSSLLLALTYGNEDDIIMISTGFHSPHLLWNQGGRRTSSSSASLQQQTSGSSISKQWEYSLSPPLSILPCNIIIGVGGSAADSLSLYKAVDELSLSTLKEDDIMRCTHRFKGTILSSSIARKVANSLQLITQSAVGDRMLSSSVILAGLDSINNTITNSIWRCDSTGQVWRCHAAMVGGGAGRGEVILMKETMKHCYKSLSTSESAQTPDELLSLLSSQDVKNFLSSLSFDDAILLATRCIMGATIDDTETIQNSIQLHHLQGILIRNNGKAEKIRHEILQQGLDVILTS